ncbi:MAG: endonuclease/exonuclease/phosphatase family protein [Rhodobacteraceae bacterium]|nr:endonuclease/exonuclease/phosphatase family protein [Paracoccaceae bacterium]
MPGRPGPITVYQRNLWFANPDLAAIAAEIRHRDPDIVLLQEVSDHTVGLLDTLRADWPAQTFCRFSGWSGIAVLSRHPMIAGSAQCSDWRGLAAMQIALGVARSGSVRCICSGPGRMIRRNSGQSLWRASTGWRGR